MARGTNEVADIEQVSGGFEQFAAGGREAVERLQSGEEEVGNVGDFAGVVERNTVAPAHFFDFAALIASEAGEFGADVAGGEIGDDAIADSGARIVEGGEMKLLQEL